MTRSFERRVSTRMHPRDPKPNLGFFSKEGNRGKIFVAARVRNVLRFPQNFATTVRFLGGKSVERGRHPNNSGRLRDMWAPSVGRHPASDNCGRHRWATSNSAADIRQQCAPLASRAPRRARFRWGVGLILSTRLPAPPRRTTSGLERANYSRKLKATESGLLRRRRRLFRSPRDPTCTPRKTGFDGARAI